MSAPLYSTSADEGEREMCEHLEEHDQAAAPATWWRGLSLVPRIAIQIDGRLSKITSAARSSAASTCPAGGFWPAPNRAPLRPKSVSP